MFKTFLLKHLVITNQKRNQIYKIILAKPAACGQSPHPQAAGAAGIERISEFNAPKILKSWSRQKTPPPFVGAQLYFWPFLDDFQFSNSQKSLLREFDRPNVALLLFVSIKWCSLFLRRTLFVATHSSTCLGWLIAFFDLKAWNRDFTYPILSIIHDQAIGRGSAPPLRRSQRTTKHAKRFAPYSPSPSTAPTKGPAGNKPDVCPKKGPAGPEVL